MEKCRLRLIYMGKGRLIFREHLKYAPFFTIAILKIKNEVIKL